MGDTPLSTPTPPPASRVRVAWALCVMFSSVGLLVAVAGRTTLFASWRAAAAEALLGQAAFPPALEPFAALTDVIIGGSIVGKWIAAGWLVRRPLAAARRWAWWALLLGLVAWFGLDSGLSLALGAWFNVWMINLAPLCAFGLALFQLRAVGAGPVAAPGARGTRAWRALACVCWGFTGVGLALALLNSTWLFAPYRAAIADAWFDGTLDAHALTWLRFTYGIIGATFGGHFLMLALALQHAPGERWVLQAVATSMLGWFLVDATGSALHGAWFNVWMVDAPALVAVALPWAYAWRGCRAPQLRAAA